LPRWVFSGGSDQDLLIIRQSYGNLSTQIVKAILLFNGEIEHSYSVFHGQNEECVHYNACSCPVSSVKNVDRMRHLVILGFSQLTGE
jgi:hypothetical protein